MRTLKRSLYRQLVATSLLIGGSFQLAAPILAQTAPTPTRAGATISNTATATYTDPNDTSTTLGATSNTVIITVAEVAGITVNNAGVTDNTPATSGIQAGDQLFYDFTITNVGNDPTTFVIPNTATVSSQGTLGGSLLVDQTGGTTFTAIPIPDASLTTGAIQPGASVRVRVPVTVNTGVASGSIDVTLGNTSPANSQNVSYLVSPGSVYTADNNTITGGTPIPEATATSPANGEREASNTQQATVNAAPQAFAAVLKNITTYSNNTTTAVTNDDTLTYGLSLRVDATAPAGSSGVTVAPLTGTALSGGIDSNTTTKFILVSDAIPENTDLNALPTAPTNWRVVYTSSNLSIPANQAVWTLTAPTTPAQFAAVTRVGFIYDDDTSLTTDSPAIAPSATPITGFAFTVRTETTFTTGGQIANIAQLFGTSQGGTSLVYDESGDQNPSNYNDSGTPGSNTPTTGVANPATDGIDPGNNAGTDPAGNTVGGGEDTVQNIAPPPLAAGILLGPEGAPTATGSPGNTNDDFTNKTTPVLAGVDMPGNTDVTDPASITFINTAQNTSNTTATISIIPTTPSSVGVADLPTNSVVTLSAVGVPGSKSYVWNGTGFVFDGDGDFTTTADQSPIDSPAEVLTFANVLTNGTVSYSVAINMPATTQLSTDRFVSDPDGEAGYPFPITAFIDTDNNGVIGATEAQNTTIDRAYVGFLRLLKESLILKGTGPDVPSGQGNFSTDPKTPAPGNIIQYRIGYTNISSVPVAGSNSKGLNANNITITENGTASPNNWGLDNDPAGTPGSGTIDTSNVTGTATESGGVTPSFFTGATGATPSGDVPDVTAYQVSTGANPVLAPGQARNFTFQRRVDD